MARYFIYLSYDGSNYHGWQIQPNAATVQETLEKALALLMRHPVAITGVLSVSASSTDIEYASLSLSCTR